MSEETTTTQQPETTHPEDNGGATGKTFTQDEVNRIVQERLAKERAKAPGDREQELTAREARLACREYLMGINAPAVLLDVLDTGDPEKFKTAVGKLAEATTGMSHGGSWPTKRTTGMSHQGGRSGEGDNDDALANAFKPKRR